MPEREVHDLAPVSAGEPWPTLAVIDDHELMREGLRALILRQAPAGTSIVYCGGSPEQACRCTPQVALLDVDLGSSGPPLMHGVDLLQQAGAHVLLMSAYEDARSVRAALGAGALGFVPKRVSFDELSRAVQVVSRGELYLSIDLASMLATAAESPDLSPRELDALRLYSSGLKLAAVAHRMGVSPHTAREYLDRVRVKYAQVGRAARTRTELFAEASRDGLLRQPGADQQPS